MGLRALLCVGFKYFVMGLPERCKLRQVGNGDNLSMRSHLFHDRRHLCCYLAAHARVYLIKDDGRQSFRAGDKRFDAKHQPAYLTAGSHFTHITQTLVEVRGKEQLYFVGTRRHKIRSGGDRYLHFGVCHTQARETFRQLLANLRHYGFATLGQCFRTLA